MIHRLRKQQSHKQRVGLSLDQLIDAVSDHIPPANTFLASLVASQLRMCNRKRHGHQGFKIIYQSINQSLYFFIIIEIEHRQIGGKNNITSDNEMLTNDKKNEYCIVSKL
jgi:hypothetical protein